MALFSTQTLDDESRRRPDDRLQQLRPRGRSLRDADLPDRGDRSRGGLRPPLRRAACARHRVVLRLRHLFAAGGLARGPLEPPLHDGGVLYRLRAELCRGGVRAEFHRARHRAVRARRVRLDLSSGRHRHRGRCRGQSRADARLQRRLRQYRRLACCRHHRGADRVDRLARRVPGAGRGLRRDRDSLFRAGAGRPQARRRAQLRARRSARDVDDGRGVCAVHPDRHHRRPRVQHHDHRAAQGDRRADRQRHLARRGRRHRDRGVPVRRCRPARGRAA